MILSGKEITQALDDGLWKAWRNNTAIQSSELKINPHSVDVTLCDKFAVVMTHWDCGYIDPRDESSMQCNIKQVGHFDLKPGQFILGAVQERFDCDAPVEVWFRQKWHHNNPDHITPMHFTQKYDGRSSMARLGILSHCTAGYGDYGFKGAFTLELFNCSSNIVRLYAGMRIGQISFEVIIGNVDHYEGAYIEQNDGPRQAKLGVGRF